MELLSIQGRRIQGKRVVVRIDGDVPTDSRGAIADAFRLADALPTLRSLLSEGCSLTILAHRGRPEGRVDPALSNHVLVSWLSRHLGHEVKLLGNPDPVLVKSKIVLLENVRFWSGEESNSATFSRQLASLGQVYCDDAFATIHREHASITGITQYLPHYAGLHVVDEVRTMSRLREDAEAPFLVIMGGAKASDKLPTMEALINQADRFVVGGLIAVTFMAAVGYGIGAHKVPVADVRRAQKIIKKLHEHNIPLYIPEDAVLDDRRIVTATQVPARRLVLDVGPKSLAAIERIVNGASTIFWNGAMGKYEDAAFAAGTAGVAKLIAHGLADERVVSGGDTVGAVHKYKLADKFTFVSSGGGATLKFLASEKLPGLEVLAR